MSAMQQHERPAPYLDGLVVDPDVVVAQAALREGVCLVDKLRPRRIGLVNAEARSEARPLRSLELPPFAITARLLAASNSPP
jgi:hypothetical protein